MLDARFFSENSIRIMAWFCLFMAGSSMNWPELTVLGVLDEQVIVRQYLVYLGLEERAVTILRKCEVLPEGSILIHQGHRAR